MKQYLHENRWKHEYNTFYINIIHRPLLNEAIYINAISQKETLGVNQETRQSYTFKSCSVFFNKLNVRNNLALLLLSASHVNASTHERSSLTDSRVDLQFNTHLCNSVNIGLVYQSLCAHRVKIFPLNGNTWIFLKWFIYTYWSYSCVYIYSVY